MNSLLRFFKVNDRGSSLSTEFLGGTTTFMTIAYIVFVQPVVLSAAGMDFGAVFTATCLSSAFASILMGISANYPLALGPAMGHNFYFAFAVVLGMQIPWEKALAVICIAGILFFILSLTNIRKVILDAIPQSLNAGITVGIGLMIALIGFEWSGIIVPAPGTYVGIGDLTAPPVALAIFGLLVTSAFVVRKKAGAILYGIILTTLVGLAFGMIHYNGIVGAPPSMAPTFLEADFSGMFSVDIIVVIAIFLFLNIFDTMGTLIGLGPELGIVKPDGKVDINRNAFLADSSGTVVGALLGTSTLTNYVESSAGMSAGAKTGLAAVVTGLFFLITPFFSPIVKMVGGGMPVGDDIMLYPVTAPALIIIGVMMMKSAKDVLWTDPAEAIPAFLTMMVMQLTVSMTDGIAFGFISYSVLSVFSGKFLKTSPAIHICSLLLLVRYIWFAG
ncbi:Xanthine/uracil/vitamin C permease [Denitrovibrio acetiphilus DSM 12809]|uniref:Xanthine/uracil/vitamin C permease n=1 Tax=Denitrovibrio acetiphilus (strain DSM 12809 / NBRC 114555 / N2460) TaxID=522772 RepID=D4H505_DENA2|nr:NCS2 family permease [Denitrovibrio acetiphilus]ADD69361.1 Xanthine/uracil/vitamin C permease [Denitrovibrio acetiphilus DSM 12809]